MVRLTATEYNERYFREHFEIGVDYLACGYWQNSYAQLVAEATFQDSYEDAAIYDAGCACGAMLEAFRRIGKFKSFLGIDLAEHMIALGRKEFGFTETELFAGSIERTLVPSSTISLVHSCQVLEHIPQDLIPSILDEFTRILVPGGRAFFVLDAVRHGEDKEVYMGDPTHVNIQPVIYWTKLFQERGLYFDVEAYNRFVKSKHGPTAGDPTNFYQTYKFWSVWALIKA